MVEWRMAKALEKLRAQINTAYPNRSTLSDGGIGDAAHAARTSDHNPWIVDLRGPNVVSARDFTDWQGIAQKIVDSLVWSMDRRIKYIIWNRKIITSYGYRQNGVLRKAWVWYPFDGSNPHTKHFHISVLADKDLYDDESDWKISGPQNTTISNEDDVKIFANYKGKIYVGDGIDRRHIENPTVLSDIKWHYDNAGVKYKDVGKVDRIDWLGKEVLSTSDANNLRKLIEESLPVKVWGYKNVNVNGPSDAYRLLTDTLNAVTETL